MVIQELAQSLQQLYGEDKVRIEAGYIFITINDEVYRLSIDKERK